MGGYLITANNTYTTNLQEMIENYKEALFKYQLIDYSKPAPHPILNPKPIEMTAYEAHSRNQGLALNGTTKRYIKIDE